MTPTHHLDDHLLVDYATGSLEEPLALIVASHLADFRALVPG